MAARTGTHYLQSLQRMTPTVFLNGRRVERFTEEQVFQGSITSIAQLYDLQHDPRYCDFMLFPSPTTGEPVHVSFQASHSRQELINKRKAFKVRTDHSFGFLGRTMDFMNQLVLNMYTGRERFAQRGQQFADNVARYFEFLRDHDLFMTHALINPQID